MKGYKTDCSVLFFPFFRLLGGVLVRALEEKILSEGRVLEGGVLQVGAFLNQLVDTAFTREMADDIASAFAGDGVTKVLTVETSGIMIAFATAAALGVPMVFAKKNKTSNLDGNLLTAEIHSFTHNNTYTAAVCADYIRPDDKILIVDDFLANGEALRGLIALVRSGGASVAGCAVQIEKGFQRGGDSLRESGVKVYSLAVIDEMSPDGGIVFRHP